MNLHQKVPFEYFVALWNLQQNQGTPHLHFRIARWLDKASSLDMKNLLLMAFRGCGKSTMIGLYAAWRLFCNPNLRIVVLSADEALSSKMVRNIKRIIEKHYLTFELKPPQADQWGIDRFTVLRTLELRDPSVLARGLGGNMTGSRAELIICDDVEVPNSCDTRGKREILRQKLIETDFILTHDGMKLFAGTPHTYHSIYTERPGFDHEDEAAVLKDYQRLVLPLIDDDQQSLWPERYSDTEIKALRKKVGPNNFASQMLLQPVNIANGRLSTKQLHYYEGEIAYVKELNRLEINNKAMRGAAAWWDPAFGLKNGDRSVLAVLYQDMKGAYWLHHLQVMTFNHSGSNDTIKDMATEQCKQVALTLKKFMIPSVSLEVNGIGRFLPGILRKQMAQQNVPCTVLEVTSRRPKDIRIMEAFDVVLGAGLLHVHQDVMKTPFATEMGEWRPGHTGHDDCIDAVAGALSMQPVRIGSHPPRSRQVWTSVGQSHTADTSFRI